MLFSLGLLLLMVLLVGVPAFVHLRWPVALAWAALLPPVLFQCGNWAYLGYLDPFWPIAMAVSTAVALVAAAVLGMVVLRWAGKR
ncbi:hypothetical protein [Acidovorax sp. RAC01]|uniref:hypothetical protein n=1 Tax=Acidovorax sp. RAC01 TaxID=1842533 RepID=UPI00083E7BFA|nr:hypothetical protein [Acidovorax sp. RAC01]AOG22018.1 putative membrane protein [Acidovorax sp. RAC01]